MDDSDDSPNLPDAGDGPTDGDDSSAGRDDEPNGGTDDPSRSGDGPARAGDAPDPSETEAGATSGEPSESDAEDVPTPGPGGQADDEGSRRRRRLLWLVLLLLLALIGGGIGTVVLDDSPDGPPGIDTPGTTPTATPMVGEVALTAPTDATLLRASDVVPGDGGTSQLVPRNGGSATGQLGIANVSRADRENGIMSAEAPVDDSPAEGELSAVLQIRLSIRFPDGRTVRAFGGGGFVPLADVEASNRTYGAVQPGEEATVILEWRVPAEAGNEIQSDELRFDIAFGLRPINGTTT